MGSPVSLVIANIYMEYFEEMALGPQYPIPIPWWKRHVDDVISMDKKDKVNTLLNHFNSVDTHIKFTMETPGNVCSIPFLDAKCSPNSDSTISTSVFRKPIHTNHYLDWNSNHPISAQKQFSRPSLTKQKISLPLKSWPKKWTTSIEYYSKTATQNGSSKIQKQNQQLLL